MSFRLISASLTTLALLTPVSAQTAVDAFGRPWTATAPLLPPAPLGHAARPAPDRITAFDDAGGFYLAPLAVRQIGGFTEGVAVGDVSGDGRADVVLTTGFMGDPATDTSVILFTQTQTGDLSPLQRYSYAADQTAYRNGLGLVDLDGKFGLDVVVGGGAGLSLFTSSGDGLVKREPALFMQADALAMVDLNADGVDEVVTVGWADGGAIYRRSAATPAMTASPWPATVAGYNSIARGDLDADGDVDVAIASGQGPSLSVGLYHNTGAGSLTPGTRLNGSCDNSPWRPSGVAIGDVNADGINDLVTASGGNRPDTCVKVYYGVGDGELAPPLTLASYDIPQTTRVADLNLDGLNDILVLHGGWMALGVYFQRPDGSLAPEQLVSIPYSSHYRTHSLEVADINSDACPDVVIGDPNSGLVTLEGRNCVRFFQDGFE